MAAFVERDRCPLCSSGAVNTLRSVDFAHPSVWRFIEQRYEGRARRRELAGRLHEIARCALCELCFPRFVLSDGALERLYEEWLPARAEPQRLGFPDLRALENHSGSSRERTRVLDLAAGDGSWALAARELGFDVVAVENSDTRRKHLRELGLECAASLDDIGRASIDYAHCDGVFARLLRPVEALRALSGRLRPGGIARIQVQDVTGAAREVGAAYWAASDDALRPLENVNGFSARALRSLGRAAKLIEVARPRAFSWRGRGRGTLAIELARSRS